MQKQNEKNITKIYLIEFLEVVMNLVEHYIVEIHRILVPEEYPHMVKVDLTYNCHGSVQRGWHTTWATTWLQELAQGYYLG